MKSPGTIIEKSTKWKAYQKAYLCPKLGLAQNNINKTQTKLKQSKYKENENKNNNEVASVHDGSAISCLSSWWFNLKLASGKKNQMLHFHPFLLFMKIIAVTFHLCTGHLNVLCLGHSSVILMFDYHINTDLKLLFYFIGVGTHSNDFRSSWGWMPGASYVSRKIAFLQVDGNTTY